MTIDEIENLYEVPTLEELESCSKKNLSNLYVIVKALKSKLDIESNNR
jgi:hypothetical protein